MGWIIGGIIVYIIIASIVIFWKITLPIIALISIAVYLHYKEKREEEKKKKEEEIREEKLQKEKVEQERIKQAILTREIEQERHKQIINGLISNSQLLSQKLPERVDSARDALNNAEQEYKDGAFAPFWDAVEVAVTSLAHFDTGINQIAKNCSEYQTESRQLESPPPVFDWKKAADASDAIATADRLQSIVRVAQKNFQFAVIYEQRKTNQILVAGFAGLGQALGQIAYRISESTGLLSAAIADLSFTVSDTVSDTSKKAFEAGRENTQAVIKSMQVIRKQTQAEAEIEAEARREHEQRELEMLDNIQHRRRPSFPDRTSG